MTHQVAAPYQHNTMDTATILDALRTLAPSLHGYDLVPGVMGG